VPQEPSLMDHLFIRVDGTDIPSGAMADLVEVTVESNAHLPDMCTLQFHDEDLQKVEGDQFSLGKELEISAQPEGGGSSQVLFKGEITALEPEFAEGTHASLIVRGYDRSHRLHRGTHTKTYVQVTDSDLANRIATDAGLRAQVDATTEVYDHVFQHNQSHMEFLTGRARRIGYEFYIEDRTLHFCQPSSDGDALELEWGQKMISFHPSMTLIEQVDELTVKGWDPKNRQVITGQATRGAAEPNINQTQTGAQTASSAFDSASRVVVDCDVHSQADADSVAQAILDTISGAYLEAEGVCYGEPSLRAGKAVRLRSLGSRFSGTYLVSSATHIYRAGEGYRTTFSIHGRRADTLLSLLESAVKEDHEWGGLVVGIVTNNQDPDGWGRVKVKFPWLSEDEESHWARVLGLGAGAERGFYCLPEVDDEVLVAFENGNFNRPFILGGLWNGQDKPPSANDEALENSNVRQRMFKTRGGHMLLFIDGKEEGVVLETKGQHRLTLGDEKKAIILETADGHTLTLDDQGKKVVLETSGGHKLTLDDSTSEMSMESSANLAIKSGGNLTLEATGTLELKGTAFSLSADANGEVKSGGTLQVQGALVKIN
jgi:phage protein D/phage baseplate assembly protein gpV